MTCQLALLADLYLLAGDTDNAIRTLDEAKELVERSEERLWEAELHRLTADVLRVMGNVPAEAIQAEFDRALEISRRTGAKSLELRAATSLARFWGVQGRREEARELLQSVYDWFTEGFDTPDLTAASSALSELS